MYKVKNQSLSERNQRLFEIRESQYDLRGICMFKKTNHTNIIINKFPIKFQHAD